MIVILHDSRFQLAVEWNKERWSDILNQHPTLVNESYSSDSH